MPAYSNLPIAGKRPETTAIVAAGWHGSPLEQLAAGEAGIEVKTLAAEIQSDVQHALGLLRLVEDARSFPPREALLHGIQ